MKMELYEQGEKVGYVVESPYDWEYTGPNEDISELLSQNPTFRGMKSPPDEDGEMEYELTGDEWYSRLGRILLQNGIWNLEVVNG